LEYGPREIGLRILIVFCLVLVNAFFAAAEMAIVSVRRTRIRQLAEDGDHRAQRVNRLLEHPTSFMATVQIGVTLVGLLASAYTAVSLAGGPAEWLNSLGVPPGLSSGIAVTAVTTLLALVTLVLGEIAPKSFAIQRAEWLALRVGGAISFLSVVAMPAVKTVSFLSDLVVRPFGGHVRFSAPMMTEEELKMLVEAGEEDGVIEAEERDMIHSVFDFTDTVARQVMVPRTDMHCAPVTASLHELLDVIDSTGHSRIPIYEDNVDSIVGVIHAKDLLNVLRECQETFDLRSVMREAYFIPETKDVGELLREFRKTNTQMAIIKDEYGGTAGLVTVEDLLEEIVGEIRDEYDEEEPMVQLIDEHTAVVNARMRIDDFNDSLGHELPESEEYDTIGGYVFDLLGHQPEDGEEVVSGHTRFTVQTTEGGRITRIRVGTADTMQSEESAENQPRGEQG
jgi:putative hemolysin